MLGDPLRLIFPADHEAGDVLEEQQRNAPLARQLDEMRPLHRRFAEQHAVVGEDRDRDAPDMREAADEAGAIERLELVELAAVHQPRDHLMHVIRRAHVLRHDAVEIVGGELGRVRRAQVDARRRLRLERRDDIADDRQRVLVILRDMIDDAGFAAVRLRAAQLFGGDFLARRRLHQRRAGEEDRALVAHDHRLVRHGGDVGTPRRAASHHAGDLRDALGGHVRLIEEDAPEMLAIGEHLGLMRQVRAARIDQIDARQPVLARDVLRAQVLLYRQRVIGAALHRGVVAHDHALAAGDAADARDHPRARHLAFIEVERRKLADLQKRGAGIKQPLDAIAGQELAASGMTLAALLVAAQRRLRHIGAQRLGQRAIVLGVGAEIGAVRRQFRVEDGRAHAAPTSSRPTSIRRISLVPAPISSSLASRQ